MIYGVQDLDLPIAQLLQRLFIEIIFIVHLYFTSQALVLSTNRISFICGSHIRWKNILLSTIRINGFEISFWMEEHVTGQTY